MVTEIIIYKSKKNMNGVYGNALINKFLLTMKKWNIQGLNYGYLIEDPLIVHLVRSLNSSKNRNETLEKFYSGDEWITGAGTQIIDGIESS